MKKVTSTKTPLNYSTVIIHSDQEPNITEYNAIIPPIVTSTVFKNCDKESTSGSAGESKMTASSVSETSGLSGTEKKTSKTTTKETQTSKISSMQEKHGIEKPTSSFN